MIQPNALIAQFKFALENHWGYILGAVSEKWTEAKQKQKVNFMVTNYGADWKKNVDAKNSKWYYAALYGSKWIGHTVTDCSGLFVYAFKQLGGSIYHGSNTMYKSYCSKKGKLNDTLKKSLLPGTAVFTGTEKDHGHVGLYVGDGKVIEASGTQAGVCTSNITANKWTYYGLLKGVQYPDMPETDPEPAKDDSGLPTLRRGDKGPYVTKAQTELAQRGYSIGSAGIDGNFGPATESAVKKFQKDWGLEQDGVIGPKTWAMLTTAPVKEKSYSVTVKGLTASQAKALCSQYKNATMKEE